jgi:multiple antibiotic resistance protein
VTRTALAAFAAFFVTIGPIDTAAVFLTLTRRSAASHRRVMAMRGTLIGGGILVLFALLGDDLLGLLDISLAAVRVGGGILLLLFSIRLVLGEEEPPAAGELVGTADRDIAVFPLALPLIASPGAITASVVLASEVRNHPWLTLVILAMMLLVLGLTLACLLSAGRLERLLGPTGMSVATRIFGFLLTALSAELVLKGLGDSGAFH